MHLKKIVFFFKDEQCKEMGTLWSSLPGVEAAGAEVLAFQGSPSTVQWKSLGCAAAAKLFNVAKDLWSREWKGENSVSLRKKQSFWKHHRFDPNPAVTYQLCP